MNQILFFFRWLFSAPINLVVSMREQAESIQQQTPRGQAFWYGLPAVLIAVLGVGALCWAQFGFASSLEDRYVAEAQENRRKNTKLFDTLIDESRMFKAANRTSAAQSRDPLYGIDEDDERRIRLEEYRDKERVYLEKLITLNPEELEYRFNLAIVSLEKQEDQRGLAIMQNLAPKSEPGYAKAHLWLAKNLFLPLSASSNDKRKKRQAMGVALQHVEHCLVREKSNKEAKLIQARLLQRMRRFKAAYTAYESLFADDVVYYEPLISINEKLEREDWSIEVLQRALDEFMKRRNMELSQQEWVRNWMHITKCNVKLNQHAVAEQLLKEELEKDAIKEEKVSQVFISQLLAEVYLEQVENLERDESLSDEEFLEKMFPLLKEAYKYNPRQSSVLRKLTALSLQDNQELASEAKAIYDADKDPDAPAEVYNELGSNALGRQLYDDALRYFELAHRKAKSNPMILNNLAYTYLVCEDPNPKRALKLIDEALRFLPNSDMRRRVQSNFYDTRGTALMQLGRMREAASAFEIAIQDRPNNRKILESLVKCYEALNLSPQAFLDRLEKLDDEETEG